MPDKNRQKGWVRRAVKKREPHIEESVKTALIVKGHKTNEITSKILSDMNIMKKPDVVSYNKRNPIQPFEDATSLEFLSNKSDCSLFVFGSHTKKRPHNVVFGRFFDNNILDMVEVGVEKFKAIGEFKGPKWSMNSKPCIIFQGQEFENNEDLKRFANILLDFFRGTLLTEINLAGLDHVIVCTVHQEKVLLRHYNIILKKSGSKIPRVELSEVGPSMDMQVRRTKVAGTEIRKEAFIHPKEGKGVKNVSVTALHDKTARVYVSQDLSNIPSKCARALKTNGANGINNEGEVIEEHVSASTSVLKSKKPKLE